MASIREYFDLHGRVAVITGGAGYLGRTMANTLAEAGADIVIVDINQEKIDVFCKELESKWNVRTLGIAADLENKDARRAVPEKVIAASGRLDILINNAAFVGTSNLTGWGVPFDQQETETWRRALGEPEHTIEMDAETAEAYRTVPGSRDYYVFGGHRLQLHADGNGVLTSVILTE